MNEDERRTIVESGPIYLSDGLRAHFAGVKNPDYCSVSSARAGFWACSWETAKDVTERPDRRFQFGDFLFKTGHGWLGVTPTERDYQTPEDYERAKARGSVE
jgi:hypothetical protein